MSEQRTILEGPQPQGEDEKVAYKFTSTPWGSSPSNISMVVKDKDGVDVTGAVTSGDIGVDGDVITLKQIEDLTLAGTRYRVEVQFTAGAGAPYEMYFFIDCEV